MAKKKSASKVVEFNIVPSEELTITPKTVKSKPCKKNKKCECKEEVSIKELDNLKDAARKVHMVFLDLESVLQHTRQGLIQTVMSLHGVLGMETGIQDKIEKEYGKEYLETEPIKSILCKIAETRDDAEATAAAIEALLDTLRR